jgi:2-polyprenyl-6-methoxyphenol hydroxylase-like FAD-dependent oxidoreductase
MTPDVLVVGAGPTGLTLACALAAQGVAVRVLDRAPGPAATSRANILHARGVEVLGRVGALGDLQERSLAPVGMTMHARGRALATMRFAPDDRESVQALFVSQAAVEAQLRRRLGELGVEVEWGAVVTGVAQDAGGVTVESAGAGPVRAGWLAGCDGAHSTVRGLAGIDFPGVAVVEQFLLADVHADWAMRRSTSAGWFHRDGMLLAIPMRGADGSSDLWRLMADVPAADERLDAAQIVARFERLLPERAGETSVRIRDAAWTSVFRIHRRLAADYRRGRVLLAGDAAHIHSPIGGQGMNTGIGDAENLGWKLGLVVHGRAGHALLDTYAAERRPLATEVLRTTTTNTRLLVGEGPVARLVRDRLLVPLLGLPAVQRRATRTASQLWVSYRDGPLGGRGRAPRPGDRVPDAACTRTDGSATRLHAELGPGWAVLAPAGEVGGVDGIVATAREHLGAVALLRAEEVSVARLVRPDGHLAWRGEDPSDLRRWLTRALLGRAA